MLLKNAVLQIVLCLLLTGLTACERNGNESPEKEGVSQFLLNHWPALLPPQGEPPEHFSALEASLDPSACGQCHIDQYQQWSTSLHAHTMGAGIQWQLQLMSQEQGNKCLRCHAPLAEQKALVALQQNWPNAPSEAAPGWLPTKLADAGLACAACHVRRHHRYGPPARTQLADELPHNGFTASRAFQDSGFCAACHQHREQDKPPRINGKLQVDTWAQWQASPQAQQDIHCQNCHMPDRKHLWRGIHDADMTREAIDVQLKLERLAPDTVNVEAIVQNTGAGHHFPTYMVPKVELVFSLRQAGSDRERVIHRHIIGWQVNVALTEEVFDTRIPAGESQLVDFPLILPDTDTAWEISMVMDVKPREHYERTFRQSMKMADKLPAATQSTLRRAIQEAEATHYRLLQKVQPIPAWSIAN